VSGDALGEEMRALGRRLDGDPLALDRGTAEWLLAGTLDPADAPPAYAAVAEVLAAAAGPPQPDELSGEAEAVARFAAHHRARRPARARRHLARLALVCAVLLGMLSAGGAGLATGVLPRTGQWLSRTFQSVVGPAADAPPRTGPGPSTSTRFAGVGGPAAPATTPGGARGSGRVAGPAARARQLCRAWGAGKGAQPDAAGLRALAEAAGGSGNVPAYCRAVPDGQGGREAGRHGGGERDAGQQDAKPQPGNDGRRPSADGLTDGAGKAGGQDAARRNAASPDR
jgi:hypothetical protein